jgi:prophage regulatory protein
MCHSWQEKKYAFGSPDRILRIRTVLERTGLSRSTLYRKIQQGTFPKQLRISERCMGWRESAVEAWLRSPTNFPTPPGTGDLLGLTLDDDY